MSFETVEGTLNISCTMVMTTALAAILRPCSRRRFLRGALRHSRRLAERKDQYRFPEGQGLRGGGRGERTGGPGLCSPRGG